MQTGHGGRILFIVKVVTDSDVSGRDDGEVREGLTYLCYRHTPSSTSAQI